MTRTATPRQARPAAPAFLQTDAGDVVARRQRVRRRSARRYTDKGGTGATTSDADTTSPEPDPPEAPGGRVRRQPVRHEHGDQHRRPPRSRACTAAASRPATGSSSTVRSTCSRSTRSRSASRTPPAGPHGRLAAGGDRDPSGLDHRPDPGHREPDLDRRHGRRGRRQTFPLPRLPAGKHELFLVFRAVTGGATGGNLFNLNWAEFGGNGVTVQSRPAPPGTAGGTVPATLSLTLGTPAAFGAVHPGRRAQTTSPATTANVISTAGDATLTSPTRARRTPASSSTARSRCRRRCRPTATQPGRHRLGRSPRSAARRARRRC